MNTEEQVECDYCEDLTHEGDLLEVFRRYNRREYFICQSCYEYHLEDLQQVL